MADSPRARKSGASEPTLPGIHALHLAELAERWNVSKEQLLGEFGLSVEALSDPAARVPLTEYEGLVQRARSLTGEPGLGFHLGLKMRISAHGYVGFAAMTAANLRQALELACRFAPTRSTALALRLEEGAREASLVIDETSPLGPARDAIIIAFMVGLWRLGTTITGQELRGSADFAFEKPEYLGRFPALLPGRVRFSQPEHRLIFDPALLDLPLVQSDPAALRLAREQCERELDELRRQGGLVARVRALLLKREGGSRSLEELARELHTSERTLKRKLREEGSSYSELLDQVRRAEATRLLESGVSIDAIAAALGYSDTANFTRAFRRWTGRTPAASRSTAPR
jgi:AraC-like DNA-binding protein